MRFQDHLWNVNFLFSCDYKILDWAASYNLKAPNDWDNEELMGPANLADMVYACVIKLW
jgi:hypothetical protein